jgi:hypothetical protein
MAQPLRFEALATHGLRQQPPGGIVRHSRSIKITAHRERRRMTVQVDDQRLPSAR